MKTKNIKALIKDRIAECKDPKTMRHLESVQEKIELYEKAMSGDIDAMMRFGLANGRFTEEQCKGAMEQ